VSLLVLAAAVGAAAAQHSSKHAPSATTITSIKDIATVVALIAGGLFTYFKFIKGRVLGPRASLKLQTHLITAPAGKRRPTRPFGTPAEVGKAIGIELCIRNTGQIQLKLPTNTQLLLTVSSITEAGAFCATDLTQDAESFKHPDAYFGETNLMLDEGAVPVVDVTIEPSEEARFTALLPIPAGHQAAAYHVVVNCNIYFKSWMRTKDRWWDSRMLVLPEVHTAVTTRTEVG
jgi:hypothetical protein